MKTKKILLYIIAFIFSGQLIAQSTDDVLNILIKKGVVSQTDADSLRADYAIKAQSAKFKASGKVWGQVFSDVIYKDHRDSAGRGTGGNLQYAGMSKDSSAMDLRRVYLGYDYTITDRFVVELLLAQESSSAGTTDLLTGGNRGLYIRLANLRWKNIYKNADLVIGQVNTPTWSLTNKVWGYRSVERSITDQRKLGSSNDVGLLLQGTFNKDANYGYNFMVGNGTAAKPEIDKFKKIYGELYGYFWNKKIFVDLYGDYERSALIPRFHQSKTTYKLNVAYQSSRITAGVEAVVQKQQNAVGYTEPKSGATTIGTVKDTTDAFVLGVSAFVRGAIIKDKLAAFVRYDSYNPDQNFKSTNFYTTPVYDGKSTGSILQTFITAGIDYSPDESVHIIPNVWYNQYKGRNDANNKINNGSSLKNNYDLVYRITIAYTFNK